MHNFIKIGVDATLLDVEKFVPFCLFFCVKPKLCAGMELEL